MQLLFKKKKKTGTLRTKQIFAKSETGADPLDEKNHLKSKKKWVSLNG